MAFQISIPDSKEYLARAKQAEKDLEERKNNRYQGPVPVPEDIYLLRMVRLSHRSYTPDDGSGTKEYFDISAIIDEPEESGKSQYNGKYITWSVRIPQSADDENFDSHLRRMISLGKILFGPETPIQTFLKIISNEKLIKTGKETTSTYSSGSSVLTPIVKIKDVELGKGRKNGVTFTAKCVHDDYENKNNPDDPYMRVAFVIEDDEVKTQPKASVADIDDAMDEIESAEEESSVIDFSDDTDDVDDVDEDYASAIIPDEDEEFDLEEA